MTADWERCPRGHASEAQHLLDCEPAPSRATWDGSRWVPAREPQTWPLVDDAWRLPAPMRPALTQACPLGQRGYVTWHPDGTATFTGRHRTQLTPPTAETLATAQLPLARAYAEQEHRRQQLHVTGERITLADGTIVAEATGTQLQYAQPSGTVTAVTAPAPALLVTAPDGTELLRLDPVARTLTVTDALRVDEAAQLFLDAVRRLLTHE